MEWNNGTGQVPVNKPTAHAGGKKKLSILNMRLANVVLVFCIAALLVLVALFASRLSNSGLGEVKKDRMQAVFLNGGQVYFGKITNLNAKTMSLSDIYYLRVNQTVQPNQTNNGQQPTNSDISLVKLGCELHGPEDSMVINQDQVIFWENLKTDGQVAKAVATYKEQNPNGQDCSKTSQNNQSNNNTTNNNNAANDNDSSSNNNNDSNNNNNNSNSSNRNNN